MTTERAPAPADPDELYSPPEYVAAARAVMGGIELDPASCAAANRVVRAERYYAKADAGETRDWRAETVWLSPPRGEGMIDKFIWRMAADYEAGVFGQGIALVDGSTESDWFQTLGASADAIIFPPKRAHFWRADANGEKTQSAALGGHALIYLGDAPDRFLAVMRKSVGGFGYRADAPRPTPAQMSPQEFAARVESLLSARRADPAAAKRLAEDKLRAIKEAERYQFPTADIDEMLEQITAGYDSPANPPANRAPKPALKDGEQSFVERWRGKFSPAERDDDHRYRHLARKYLT